MYQLKSCFLSSVSMVAFLVVACQGTVKITVTKDPVSGETYLKPGGNIKLVCTTDQQGKDLKWEVSDGNTTRSVTDIGSTNLRLGGGNTQGRSEIDLSNLSGDVGGTYICGDGISKDSYSVNILDNKSLIPDHILENGTSSTVVLHCRQRLQPKLPLIWTRTVAGKDYILNDIPAEDRNYTVSTDAAAGYPLTIRNVRRYPSKNGAYRCQLNTTGVEGFAGEVIEAEATYQTTPDVRFGAEIVTASRSKSATKDEPLSLMCVVSGAGADNEIVWSRINENGTRENLQNDTNHYITRNEEYENRNESREQLERTSVLNFNTVTDGDKGTYSCDTGNPVGVASQSIELKVKDKLAALWPFLGIVAEVVILCAIIFIYERRRNKSMVDEEEEEPMKGGDVRETREVTVRSRK